MPIAYVELAYLAGNRPSRRTLNWKFIATATKDGMICARQHIGAADTYAIIGSPQLDDLPTWRPVPGTVLVLSGVSAEREDAARLPAIARDLVTAGWEVTARLHPREDTGRWAGLRLDRSPTPAHAASTAQLVVGTLGTAVAQVAALGAPYVALETRHCASMPLPLRRAATVCASPDQVVAAVHRAQPASADAVTMACGPVGGAAERLWQLVTAVT